MEDKQLTFFKVRDLRQKTQFKIDDAYLNGYARVCEKEATLVYNSLCRHAEFHSQKAFPSQQKIAYQHKISIRSVRKGIKKLEEYYIIIVEQNRVKGKFMNFIYILLDKSEWKPLTIGTDSTTANHRHQTVGRLTAYGVGPTKDNKEQRITNIKDNKEESETKVSQSSNGKDINELIEFFKPINPNYERFFSNKTQRGAIDRMLKKMGREQFEKVLKVLPKIFGEPYAPRITSPLKLEEKMADLISYFKTKSQEKINFLDFNKL